ELCAVFFEVLAYGLRCRIVCEPIEPCKILSLAYWIRGIEDRVRAGFTVASREARFARKHRLEKLFVTGVRSQQFRQRGASSEVTRTTTNQGGILPTDD